MPQSKRGRILFALFTCLASILIALHAYRRALGQSFLEAIRTNDAGKALRLLQRGALLETRDNDVDAALAWAADRGDDALVRLLLTRGGRAYAFTGNGCALFNAIDKSHVSTLRLLLNRCRDINAPLPGEQTLLGRAQADADAAPEADRASCAEVLGLLREQGAHFGLFEAAEYGDTTELQRRLDLGMDVSATNAAGEHLLYLAAMQGHAKAVRLLLEHGAETEAYSPLKALNTIMETALSAAARHGDQETVRVLLAGGADVNARSRYVPPLSHSATFVSRGPLRGRAPRPPFESTALIEAAQSNKVDVIRLLLAHGANVRACRDDGSTTLMVAVTPLGPYPSFAGMPLRISRLPFSGTSTSTESNVADVMHAEAQTQDRLRTVKLLIDSGADVRAVNRNGSTALTLAVRRGALNVVRLLLDHGADITTRDRYNRTILGLAYVRERYGFGPFISPLPGLVPLLRAHGAHLSLQEAAEYGEVDELKRHLKHGENPNSLSLFGAPVLLAATASGQADAVHTLLDHGAKIDAADTRGWTALMVAAANGNADLVRLLLAHGADRNHKNKVGLTTLAVSRTRLHLNLLPLLQQASVHN